MKNKNSFIFKGLISLVLSLVMIFGTTVTSLSAVTDNIVAAVTEPVRSAIPDAPAPAQATDETDLSPQSAPIAPDYAVAEGSLTNEPTDDDVLDIAIDEDTPAVASYAPLSLSSKKDTELAATGALTATEYYIGNSNSGYKLVNENGWKIKNSANSMYLTVNAQGNYASIDWNNSGTTLTVGSVSSDTSAQLYYSSSGRTYYIKYDSSFSVNSTEGNRVPIVAAVTSCTVTFNANGGTGTMADQTISGTDTLTANTFTREGYTFTGWNTAADGSGTSYNNGASVTLTASIILYAQWQQDAPPVSANTLYFTNVSGWNYLKAYLYNDTTGAKNSAFPGTTMTDLQQNDGYGHGIYSIEVDPSVYEYVIFSNTDTSGGNTTAHAQTVSIKIEDALANGAGIYCVPSGSGYETDSQGHLQVNCYTYGDKSSTGDPNTITYTKQIEKLNPSNDDDYNYRLHLNVDGSSLKDSSTEVTPGSGESTGIVLLIDITKDFNATTSDNQSKLTVIQNIVNNYINQFAQNQRNKISVILVKGEQSGSIDSNGTVELKKAWDNNQTITLSGETVHYTANFKAGLVKAGKYLSSAGTDKTAVVFITNSNPQFSVHDDGSVITNQEGPITDETAAKTDILNYLPTFFSTYNTDLHILDVEQESEKHDTPKAMGTYIESAGKGTYRTAGSSQELIDSFDKIIETIIPADKTSSITVTDTLSKYVDFASNKNLSATLYTGENFTTTTDVSSFVTISGDTVTFSRAAEIEGPFKLEIAFNIKTADGVLRNTDTYGTGRDGYPNAGDADTDSTTATSAGKPGYYANSSATISYTLNGTAKSGTFIKPVVQAPAETPVSGSYIFKYTDRLGVVRTKTVPVTLNSSEKIGYSGNGNQAGVPTFLWTTEAQNIFSNNPLVAAALALEGNAENGGDNWQKDASVYKNDIVWNNLVATEQGSNVTYDATNHTVTVTATTTPYTFTLEYYTVVNNTETKQGAASGLPYGKAVTFNPIYSGSSAYSYVNYTVPSEGFSYWSADPEGNIPITTNLTYGMIMRGDYMDDNDDDKTVHIYAQYNRTINEAWKPLIEEVKLTHTIDDDHDWVYLDYMTNYLSQAGTVVQEMEVKPEYGIVVAKYSSEMTTLDQTKMESVADAMISGDKSSAYLNNEKTAIAYRFNYSDNAHISDFNRVLYTLKSDTDKAENMQFTAIAYIVVDDVKYYSLINTDITVIDLVL